MHSYQRAITVALATFGASVLGMALQLVVPAQVLSDSKGTVGAMVGLITLLLALVLGLLVYTAFTVYSTQQAEAQGLGPVVIELDDLLEQYGPEALRGRVDIAEARNGARLDRARPPRPPRAPLRPARPRSRRGRRPRRQRPAHRPPRPVDLSHRNRLVPTEGYSLAELDQAGLSIEQAEYLGLPVDAGRVGSYGPNVSQLRDYLRATRTRP